MLHFNELRITQDNRFLIIDVSVDNQDYFEDVLLDSIVIDTQDTFVMNGPSDNPLYVYNVEDAYDLTYSLPEQCNCNPVRVEEDESYCFTYGTQQMKNVRLELSIQDLKVSPCSTMFFVYVKSKGTPSTDTPCGFDKDQILGTVINLQPIYKQTLKYLREVECDCEIPKGFIDMILKLKAIELCVRTGNYVQAVKYWKKFFIKNQCKSPTSNCGCYG